MCVYIYIFLGSYGTLYEPKNIYNIWAGQANWDRTCKSLEDNHFNYTTPSGSLKFLLFFLQHQILKVVEILWHVLECEFLLNWMAKPLLCIL